MVPAICFLSAAPPPIDLADFERVFDLFDGNDEAAVVAARLRWKTARDGGHGVTYWQQTERGWQKKV